jgi:List-Bact-rpt repeat protein
MATFTTQYYLTMTHGTDGRVTPASRWKNSGATVSISATPFTGYSFTNWTGTGTGSYSGPNNPASITMDGPITEMANFIHH